MTVSTLLLLCAQSTLGTNIYVATDITSLENGNTFPSIEAARDAMRAGLGKGTDRQVFLGGGTHFLDRPFVLDSRDAATADAPITYTSSPGEHARLSGGKSISPSAFKPVITPSVPSGVVVANLFSQGLNQSSLGALANPYPHDLLELFFEGKPMTLARDPNILDDSYKTWEWSGYENITAVDTNVDNTSFTFADTSAAMRWRSALVHADADLWMHGYWKFDWRDTFVKVNSIELNTNDKAGASYTVTREATTKPQYNWVKGCRFYAVNALELLDRPGEYFVNRTSGDLFFWPPTPLIAGSDVVVSVLANIINTKDAAHNHFQDLTISVSRGNAVTLSAVGSVLKNCTVTNAGGGCASVNGDHSSVFGCTVFGCGGHGISIAAGDVHTLRKGNSSAVGNTVTDYSRIVRTYQAAIGFSGVGLYIANNSLSNGPHTAITGGGNDNLFEYNNISHVSYECTDTGAFYVGRSWAQRGNVARYNHFDTIRPTEKLAQKSCSQNAFYLDDEMSGWEFYGNTIRNSSTGVLLGGGRRNRVHDNYFVDNDIDIAFDNRGMNWQEKSCQKDCDPALGTSCFAHILESLHYQQPPYSTAYPELVNIFNASSHPCVPVGNTITNNRYCHTHSSGGGKFVTHTATQIEAWFSSISNNTEHCV